MAESQEDKLYQAVYAKSSRASCKKCKENIAKDSLRMAIMVQSPMFDGKVPHWHHFSCFWSRAAAQSTADIAGYSDLRWDDQEKVKKAIESGGAVGGDQKGGATGEKTLNDFAVEYAKSNRSKCKGCDLKIEKDQIRVSKKTVDPEKPQLGLIDRWYHTACFVSSREELAFKPEYSAAQLKGFNALRAEDKEELKKRLPAVKTEGKRKGDEMDGATKKQKKEEDDEKKKLEEQLKNQSQLIWGIKDKLRKFCSTNDMKELLIANSQEVPSGESNVGNHALYSTEREAFQTRQNERARTEERESASSSKTKKMKLTVKGGAAVDPDSGLENSAHVLEQSGKMYSATLGLVDIVRGTNSYYKLQLLEDDVQKRYWVFRSWGRVGTTIGGNKLDKFHDKNSAMDNFLCVYKEKTGNTWSTSNFTKYPNKFYPLEIDYGQDEEAVKKLTASAGTKSKLAKPIQELIKMIFDVESMKKAMVEFEIDLQKMPLGKLSKRQIQSAYSLLTDVQQAVTESLSEAHILDLSNRFYTLIPHDFGMKKPPLLNSLDYIQNKVQMLDNLLDIEVAYSLLRGGAQDDESDPIDINYEKLKTKIEVVDKSTTEAEIITQYVKNTHAATHNTYTLEVEEIFKIVREGERQRYRPFEELNNRQLLWHGSRKTNYAGIMSQGLRIAPPEAPVTGYMFGKGVYFADMVSKSANYCHTSQSDPVGLLLLAEVALGNMHELKKASHITKVPKGKHSVKGVGRTAPDPSASVTLDGVQVPLGKGSNTNIDDTSLLYNEYIVYDVSQVNMKYLLKIKFNYQTSLW
ncbi:poly [ADP-ribose] polymerase 1 [Notothenia coriiceps]|uniref:Poly [ADP-ribose] polymerase n=1 Tax=Notothenia coriiceps TaxID=8208 RepID=A0A6I9P207_9TELE|nr:PREDICTED: poly [ADP-ribose] polymerase 1 [Notothenia coriiceps]